MDRREFFKTAAGGSVLGALPSPWTTQAPAPATDDRGAWIAFLRRIADPVLNNLASGTLKSRMPVEQPAGGFYLWLKTPGDDTEFTRELFARQNVTVLPGSYLSREAHGHNPGAGYVRLALVAEMDECVEAAERIREVLKSL